MRTRTKLAATSMLAVATLVATPERPLAQNSGRDAVVVNESAERRSLSILDILRLEEIVNPLEAPDTSDVVADNQPSDLSPGINTRHGIVAIPTTRAYGTFGFPTRPRACRTAIKARRAPPRRTVRAPHIRTGPSAS